MQFQIFKTTTTGSQGTNLSGPSNEKILTGNWWFLRAETIPQIGTGKAVAMSKVSADAARICAHRTNLQLAGISEWLKELQHPEAKSLATRSTDRNRLKEAVNIVNDVQWRRILSMNLGNWSPDFLYKLGLLRNTEHVHPIALDWTSHLTWLVTNQLQLPASTMPIEPFIYSACAMELCDRFQPLPSRSCDPLLETAKKIDGDFSPWKRRALARCQLYAGRSFPLLSTAQISRMTLLVRQEQDQFFHLAAEFSQKLQAQLKQWKLLK